MKFGVPQRPGIDSHELGRDQESRETGRQKTGRVAHVIGIFLKGTVSVIFDLQDHPRT